MNSPAFPYASATLEHPNPAVPILQRHVHALLVSPRLEVRKPLLQVLEAFSTDVVCCSNLAQAEEVLSTQSFEVVFCDEFLPDGSYADLIHPNHFENKIPRVIVATRVGEWELYLEALRRGAFDVVRAPFPPTDVEMTVIRALREEETLSRTAFA